MRTDVAMDNPSGAPVMPERSYWKVAVALAAVVAIIVTGAFVLNSQLRSRVGIEPAPTVSETVATEQGGTASQATAQEILDAYSRYWQVRSEAYLNLDTSSLSEVMAGQELAREIQQLADFKSQRRALRVRIEHHPVIVDFRENRATVYDEYVNRSVLLDADSLEPVSGDPAPQIRKVSYELAKFGDTWKVVDGAQHP